MNENINYYEVCFKCTLKTFISDDIEINVEVGDYVTVQCEKGYDMGIISRKLIPGVDIDPYTFTNAFKILSKVDDDKKTIEDLLYSKIIAENEALTLCRNYCHGRKVGSLLEVVTTEFQYDHKKLTIFVKKIAEVSVCKLVRKLFDSFHTRICVEEVYSVDPIISTAETYLSLTGIPLTLLDVYFDSTRMPPQDGKNKSKKSGPRTQNGYTQSGANSSLLSALHHYRPNIATPTDIYQPSTLPLSTPSHISPISSHIPYSTNASSSSSSSYGMNHSLRNAPSSSVPYQTHGRNDQRFNERIYNPSSMIKPQYHYHQQQYYDTNNNNNNHNFPLSQQQSHHSNSHHPYPPPSNHYGQKPSRMNEYPSPSSLPGPYNYKSSGMTSYYPDEIDYSYNHNNNKSNHHHYNNHNNNNSNNNHHRNMHNPSHGHIQIDDYYYSPNNVTNTSHTPNIPPPSLHDIDATIEYTSHLNSLAPQLSLPSSYLPPPTLNDYQSYDENNPSRITLSINEGETVIELPGQNLDPVRKTFSNTYDDNQSYPLKYGSTQSNTNL